MERLGIIGGSAFLRAGTLPGTEARRVETERGPVVARVAPGFVFVRRHGHEGYRPPHRIPHHAHVLALEALEVRRAISLCSVGALDAGLRPGTVVIPEDYMSFHAPPSFAGDERLHIVPRLDAALREHLLGVTRRLAAEHEAWGGASPAGGIRSEIRDGGVYAETRGPRFETRAEIRLLADYADVVGMTGASEATLLQERGIPSAILAMVDNFAHGIGARPLTLEAFDRQLEANAARAAAILEALTAGGDARITQPAGGDA